MAVTPETETIYPYDRMKLLLEKLNKGCTRGQKWTANAKPSRGVLALAPQNDPFYCGSPAQREKGEWFADLYGRLGFEGRRTHLRFIHYVASGEEPHPETGEVVVERKPNGEPYENTEENWDCLQEAAKFARHMGLVDPRQIVDRRTPRPHFYGPGEPADKPYVSAYAPTLTLPEVKLTELRIERGSAYAMGYDYSRAHEPSLVELWVEKDLDQEDSPVISRICEEEGVNLITGIGFMTISSVHTLLERRAALDKPLRILYMSDFDPAGEHMPVSPARHIEFALNGMDPRPDIRLHHLALTREQAEGLPRMPIKEKDRRKAGFEARHGKGAVELNALMNPTRVDEAEWMLRDAIRALRDPNLRRKLRAAEDEADAMLRDALEGRLRWPHRALEIIEERAREVEEQYAEEIRDLAARMEADIAPLRDHLERVRQAVEVRMQGVEELEIPPVDDLAEEQDDAAEGWLYDSRRDYFEQLRYYKRHKRGTAHEELRSVHPRKLTKGGLLDYA